MLTVCAKYCTYLKRAQSRTTTDKPKQSMHAPPKYTAGRATEHLLPALNSLVINSQGQHVLQPASQTVQGSFRT